MNGGLAVNGGKNGSRELKGVGCMGSWKLASDGWNMVEMLMSFLRSLAGVFFKLLRHLERRFWNQT